MNSDVVLDKEKAMALPGRSHPLEGPLVDDTGNPTGLEVRSTGFISNIFGRATGLIVEPNGYVFTTDGFRLGHISAERQLYLNLNMA